MPTALNDPPRARRRIGRARQTAWIAVAMAAVIGLTAAVFRGCTSDFRRALPISARHVRTQIVHLGTDYAFHARADVDPDDFLRVADRLGLRPFDPAMPYADKYFMDNHATHDPNDGGPVPPWFTPPTDIRTCWVYYSFGDYRAARYHEGTLYYLKRTCFFGGLL